jgi:prepilin-type processing-associated H-X9-DG protein
MVFRVPGVALPDRSRPQVLVIELAVVLTIVIVLTSVLYSTYRRAAGTARGAVCMENLRRLGQMLVMYQQDYDEYYPPLPHGRDLDQATRPVVAAPLAWTVRLEPYRDAKQEHPFACPAAAAADRGAAEAAAPLPTYAYNAALGARVFPRFEPASGPVSLAGVDRPSRTFLIYDTANRSPDANALSGYRFFYGSPRQAPFRPGDFVLPTQGVREPWVRPRHAGGATNVLYCDGHIGSVEDPGIRLQEPSPFDPAAASPAAVPPDPKEDAPRENGGRSLKKP